MKCRQAGVPCFNFIPGRGFNFPSPSVEKFASRKIPGPSLQEEHLICTVGRKSHQCSAFLFRQCLNYPFPWKRPSRFFNFNPFTRVQPSVSLLVKRDFFFFLKQTFVRTYILVCNEDILSGFSQLSFLFSQNSLLKEYYARVPKNSIKPSITSLCQVCKQVVFSPNRVQDYTIISVGQIDRL